MNANSQTPASPKGPKTDRWFHTPTGFGRLLRSDSGWLWIKLYGNAKPVPYRPEHPDVWEAKPCSATGGFIRANGGAK